ncbi:MAG TPA: PQQ-dependent sugar dehydrogenase [Ignavibacteria bacterium]|nr:PQQ-dependent sugar dehydrogenase [Ignavibacteria bacterium]
MKTILSLITGFTIILAIFTAPRDSFSQYAIHEAFPNLTFVYPVEMVTADDGSNRLFVLEKGGKIKVFENDPNVSTTKTFLDITDRVSQYFYAGLFGIAFHPDYEINRYFYVYYMSGTGASLTLNLNRYTASAANPDSALKDSEFALMTVPCPNSNHNGSSIRFGADGYLYFGFGDSSPGSGGDPNNKAQNKSEIFGKVNRISVDSASGGRNYAIPSSNPYYQNTDNYREEIFAYGFRNMWKFSFDEVTGKLWLADVGQTGWEEIDIVESGKNYGWRRKEGFVCFNPQINCDTAGFVPTDPVYAYNHSVGTTVTGGYVYRGSKMPGLYGKYIYADYTTGKIFALTPDSLSPPVNQQLFDTQYSIVSFAEDTAKDLYFIHFSSTAGKIYKLSDTTVTTAQPVTGNTANSLPSQYALYQNYPNPFNPSTDIEFALPVQGLVMLKVYDMNGRQIAVILNDQLSQGTYKVRFRGTGLPSGIYFYELNAGDFKETRRMVMVK